MHNLLKFIYKIIIIKKFKFYNTNFMCKIYRIKAKLKGEIYGKTICPMAPKIFR